MFCNKCGRNLPEGAKFCDVCGKPVSAAAQAPAPDFMAPQKSTGAAPAPEESAPAGDFMNPQNSPAGEAGQESAQAEAAGQESAQAEAAGQESPQPAQGERFSPAADFTNPQYSPYAQNYAQQACAPDSARYDEPLSFGQWLLTLIVLAIPFVGFIMTFVWAFCEGNVSRKNFCRAAIVLSLILIVVAIVVLIFAISIDLPGILYFRLNRYLM